jgi:integrase
VHNVFCYAIATSRIEHDQTAGLKGALTPVTTINRAAITDPAGIGQLLRAIDAYQGSFVVQCALKFAPLTFVRPGELRQAEWSEINLEAAEWNIPGSSSLPVSIFFNNPLSCIRFINALDKMTVRCY